jgi:hypothetical protein
MARQGHSGPTPIAQDSPLEARYHITLVTEPEQAGVGLHGRASGGNS